MLAFRKTWFALFSFNHHFEIEPFPFLPTNYEGYNKDLFFKNARLFILLLLNFVTWYHYLCKF